MREANGGIKKSLIFFRNSTHPLDHHSFILDLMKLLAGRLDGMIIEKLFSSEYSNANGDCLSITDTFHILTHVSPTFCYGTFEIHMYIDHALIIAFDIEILLSFK